MTKSIKYLLEVEKIGEEITLQGWLRNKRLSKNVAFLNINDGSTIKNIQIVAETEQFGEDFLKSIGIGAGVWVKGKLIESQGTEQRVEVQASEMSILGNADQTYPIQPKKHSLEFLREKAHLRPRTNTFGAVFRIRHALAFAIHKYFHENGFFHWHTPIITGSDAEGAGEMFRVSILPFQNTPLNEEGKVDFKQDFFGKETNLTVSGQLEAELGALALGKVYTFGPTFRAENSNTTRHLAEFWMIEPEMAFYEAEDNANLAEDCLKYLIRFAIENYADDMAFLHERLAQEDAQKPKDQRSEMGLLDKLNFVVENDFARITYTDAIEILLDSKPYKKKQFKFPVEWGIDLQSEHERFLVEKHFKKPVIVRDYPKAIKAFYMKQNEGEEQGKETVRAMDILVPGIGEIIGGSQREEVYERLKNRTDTMGITEELWWYLETRKFGTVPHSGFGLGFERLVQFVTGMGNIRDVIPFPRSPQNAEF